MHQPAQTPIRPGEVAVAFDGQGCSTRDQGCFQLAQRLGSRQHRIQARMEYRSVPSAFSARTVAGLGMGARRGARLRLHARLRVLRVGQNRRWVAPRLGREHRQALHCTGVEGEGSNPGTTSFACEPTGGGFDMAVQPAYCRHNGAISELAPKLTLLDDTLDVSVLLSKVLLAKLGGTLTVSSLRREDKGATLTLATDNATHLCSSWKRRRTTKAAV